MPALNSAADHLTWKKQNLDLVALLRGQNANLDWQVTAYFYAAIHHVDAAVLKTTLKPKPYSKHGDRIMYANRHWPRAGSKLAVLKDRSEECRYECSMPNATDVEDAEKLFNEIVKLVFWP